VATFDTDGEGGVETSGAATVGLAVLTGSETFRDGDAGGDIPAAIVLSLTGSIVKDRDFNSFGEYAGFCAGDVVGD